MEAPSERIGDYASQLLERQLKRIVSLQGDVLEDRDPEPLHQLRVSLRRLRCVLQQFEPFLVLPSGASERRVGRMCSNLGLTRDLDVLRHLVDITLTDMLGPEAGKELGSLRKALARERKRAADDMKQCLRSAAYLKLIARLQSWLRDPVFQPAASGRIQDWIDELIFPWVATLWLHPSWALDPIEHPNDLHALRSRIRRCRYMIENLEPICSPRLDQHLRRFKTLQDILGDLHDLKVFEDLVVDARIKLNSSEKSTVLQLSLQRQQALVEHWHVQSRRMLRSSQRKVLYCRLRSPR